MATLLELVADIANQIRIPVPATVIGNNEEATTQILRFVHQAGNELMREHSWSALRNQRTFTGIAAQEQTGEPPAAFHRFVPNTGLWNIEDRREVMGVMDNGTWLKLTIDNVAAATEYWSFQQGIINILPVTDTSSTYRYAYVSKYWVRPTGATTNATDKAAFTVDTDFPILPDELLIQSVVWRWKQAKGLDYAEDMMTFERSKEKAIGDDRGPHMVRTSSLFRSGVPDNFMPWEIG